METDDSLKRLIREEVGKAHRIASEFRCDYKRFGYAFKMRNEIYRIIDFVNGTDFYKMNEIKRDFNAVSAEARENGSSTGRYLDSLCRLVEEYAVEYRKRPGCSDDNKIKE